MTIHEMLSYGPIVAHSEDYGLFVTINGAYLNLWAARREGDYENTDCRATDGKHYSEYTWIEAQEAGNAWITEITAGWENE